MRGVGPIGLLVALIALPSCGGAPPLNIATLTPARAATPAPSMLASADYDRDGVPDDRDKCPREPEDKDGIDDADGCPEEDADGDGIADMLDGCPKEPGAPRSPPNQNGCPYVDRFEPPDIVLIPRVAFGFGDATAVDASGLAVLDQIADTLAEHPEIMKVEIQGDASPDEPDPNGLSERRAKRVMEALVARGVEPGRLVSKGYGAARPIDDNATKDGRKINRRVGFQVLEQKP
jgi:OOP family OmpA-OmpF porin